MKKVAIVFSGAKHKGGVETYLTNLFKNVDEKKVDLTLFSLGRWDLVTSLEDLNCKTKVFSKKRIRIKTIFEIAKELKSGDYDLVVSQGVVANAYARAASAISGVPNLITVHSAFTQDYPNPLIRFCYFMVDRALRWRTKEYITVSKFLKENLIRSGINKDKVEVIYNGVSAPVIPTVVEESRKRSHDSARDDKAVIIGSIGRLHPVKNYQSLIEAVAGLKDNNVKLEIAGGGSERAMLEKKIAELGLESQVSLLGQVDNIGELLASWDLYVQPSFSEGFGLTVIEAMESGLPVVVTPGGALVELVKDGKTGLVSEGFDAESIAKALKQYLDNPELAKSCAKNGQREAKERFSINVWVDKTISKYLETAK